MCMTVWRLNLGIVCGADDAVIIWAVIIWLKKKCRAKRPGLVQQGGITT